jgi:hypothetical protein
MMLQQIYQAVNNRRSNLKQLIIYSFNEVNLFIANNPESSTDILLDSIILAKINFENKITGQALHLCKFCSFIFIILSLFNIKELIIINLSYFFFEF